MLEFWSLGLSHTGQWFRRRVGCEYIEHVSFPRDIFPWHTICFKLLQDFRYFTLSSASSQENVL